MSQEQPTLTISEVERIAEHGNSHRMAQNEIQVRLARALLVSQTALVTISDWDVKHDYRPYAEIVHRFQEIARAALLPKGGAS